MYLAVKLLCRFRAETECLGEVLGRCVKGGDFIGLSGPLGAGKTEFVRGMAKGLSVTSGVSSPSYVLENIYKVNQGTIQTFHHWDLYRLNDEYKQSELLDYSGDNDKVVAIEWPERVKWVKNLLCLEIELDYVSADVDSCSEVRQVRAHSLDARGDELVADIRQHMEKEQLPLK